MAGMATNSHKTDGHVIHTGPSIEWTGKNKIRASKNCASPWKLFPFLEKPKGTQTSQSGFPQCPSPSSVPFPANPAHPNPP